MAYYEKDFKKSLENPEKLLEEEKEKMKEPKKAIMDLGARTDANTSWDKVKWFNPRLDSMSGFHGDDRAENDCMGMMDTILQSEYEASKIIWKKRGDDEGP